MPRVGLAVPIDGMGLQESLELACHAESLGYTDVWSYEVDGADGFTPLAWLSARTSTVRLGISVVPAFTRPPALLAMSSASVQELSGGRFVLGLGSSSKPVVEGWMGLEHARPLTRVRETLEAVRLALSGERVVYGGETVHVDGFRLGLEPRPVPVVLGALGPRMHRLAGSAAEGVVLVFNVPERTGELLGDFRAGASDVGRDPAELEVVAKVFVAVDEGLEDLGPQLRRFVTGYGIVPAYNALLARQGFRSEAEAMAGAWAQGRRSEAAAAVSDDLLRALFVFGDADHCRARLGDYLAAGVTTLIVAPITAAADPRRRRERLQRTVEVVAGLGRSVDTADPSTYIETQCFKKHA